jgi:hypothetical protein
MKMVNTFLTHPDYEKSAKTLDNKRLGKQRVEAKQILDIIQDLYTISSYYDWEPFPQLNSKNNKEIADIFIKRGEWVKIIRKKYISLNKRLVYVSRNNKLILKEWSLEKIKEIPKIKSQKEKIEIIGDCVIYKDSKYKRKDIILPHFQERIISLGFGSHPIVKMWIGYEDSLKLYINAHIREWCSRKNKDGKNFISTMELYNVKTDNHPWWIYYDDFHYSHKASLLRKEKDRNEPLWYWNLKEFKFIMKNKKLLNMEYIWTLPRLRRARPDKSGCNLEKNNIIKILNHINLYDEEGYAIINLIP